MNFYDAYGIFLQLIIASLAIDYNEYFCHIRLYSSFAVKQHNKNNKCLIVLSFLSIQSQQCSFSVFCSMNAALIWIHLFVLTFLLRGSSAYESVRERGSLPLRNSVFLFRNPQIGSADITEPILPLRNLWGTD